ncbi:unnamed protein product [Cunninghamella echinulata]
MTLLPYLGILSVGSPIFQQRRSLRIQREIQELRTYDNANKRAELQVLATISLPQPLEKKKYNHNSMSGMGLAIGTMISNYAICFPIVVARHGLQALSIASSSWKRDTPRYCFSLLYKKYQLYGFKGLYAGFGIGLIGQAVTAVYESFLARIARFILPKLKSPNHTFIIKSIHKCLRLAIHIPLYPLFRTALVLRVQPSNAPLIRSVKDFLIYYLHDLQRFFILSPTQHTFSLSLISTFLPSCLFNLATEKGMMLLYKRLYQYIPKKRMKKRKTKDTSLNTTTTSNGLFNESSSSSIDPQLHHRSGEGGGGRRGNHNGRGRGRIGNNNNQNYNEDQDDFDNDLMINNLDEKNDRYSSQTTMLQVYYPEIACSVISSMIIRGLSYPMDTVIFKLMIQDTGLSIHDTNQYTGFFHCCSMIYQQGGWRGFFPGWGASVLEMAATYMVLEMSWWAYRFLDHRASISPSSASKK